MSEFDFGRERRAAELRPKIKRKMVGRSRRSAANEIGVSDMALKRFLEGETPYDTTLDKYAAWVGNGATGDTGDDETRAGPGTSAERDLARQIDAVLERRLSGMETTALVAEIRAAYGMAAMRELAEAVRAAERGSVMRASALARYLAGESPDTDFDDDPRTMTPMPAFKPEDVLEEEERERRKARQ